MAETEVAAAPSDDVEQLATLIATTSRMLAAVGRLEPFKSADISLAEWLALSTMSEKDAMGNKQLARHLGVTGQRVNQLSTSLAKAELIAVEQSTKDGRRNIIKMTDGGKRKLVELNSQLQKLLAAAWKGEEKSLGRAARQMRKTMVKVQAISPTRSRKKAEENAEPGSDGRTRPRRKRKESAEASSEE